MLEMKADPPSLAYPTRLLRYLALRTAPSDTLAAARELIREWREWHRAGIERDLADVCAVSPERAREVQGSILESRQITSRQYQEDHRA